MGKNSSTNKNLESKVSNSKEVKLEKGLIEYISSLFKEIMKRVRKSPTGYHLKSLPINCIIEGYPTSIEFEVNISRGFSGNKSLESLFDKPPRFKFPSFKKIGLQYRETKKEYYIIKNGIKYTYTH